MWATFFNFGFIFQVMKDDGEETFGTQLEVEVGFRFPVGRYPSPQSLLSGPESHEFFCQGMVS